MKLNTVVLILILFSAIFIPFLYSDWGLTESSEARYAEIAKEMYTSGDYVMPRLMGLPHLHKPPVTYYITSLGFSIFGVNEYGARFFLQVALFIQVLLVFHISLLLYKNKMAALAAALVYFSFPIVQIASRNLTTDAYLTTFIIGAIYCLLKYRVKNKYQFLYLFYTLSGIAFLTKGPVALLPIFIFAIGYQYIHPQKIKLNFHHILGVLIFLIVSASWFLILFMQDPELYTYFTQHQIVDRVRGDSFNRQQPFWYYFLLLPLVGLPAIIYFIVSVVHFFKQRKESDKQRSLLLVTLAILLFIFSVSSSKLVLYILPLYLFIAVASGKYLVETSYRKLKIYRQVGLIFGLTIMTALFVAACIDTGYALPPIFIIPASVLGIVILLLSYKKLSDDPLSPAWINAIVIVIISFIFPIVMHANETAFNSTKEMAKTIKAKSAGKNKLIVYDELLPSLAFYTDLPIETLHHRNYKSLREIFDIKSFTPNKRFNYLNLETFNVDHLSGMPQNKNILIQHKDFPIPDSLIFILPRNEIIKFGRTWQVHL